MWLIFGILLIVPYYSIATQLVLQSLNRTSFDGSISLNGPFVALILANDSQTVTLSGAPDFLNVLVIAVNNNSLSLSIKSRPESFQLNISVPTLRSVAMDGECEAIVHNLFTAESGFSLKARNVSKITLMDQVRTNSFKVDVSDGASGSFVVEAKNLDVTGSGHGRITGQGRATIGMVKLSGTAWYHGFNVITSLPTVDIQDGATAQVNGTDEVRIVARDHGLVMVGGAAKVTQDVRGSALVRIV